MFLVKPFKAKLKMYNRDENNEIYDDQNFTEETIMCCPYNIDSSIHFSSYTKEQATGYYQLPRNTNVKVGDQIIDRDGITRTVIKVNHGWCFNRIENIIIAVK